MKEKLQTVFKPTPDRFRYTVQSAILEADDRSASIKNPINRKWRALIAVVLIAALIPSAVFGASKLRGLTAKPIGNYGLTLAPEGCDIPENYPQYVKMHVAIPDGFAAVPNTDEMKFYSLTSDKPYSEGFSLFPMRFTDSSAQAEYIGNVGSYTTVTVGGHPGYSVKMSNGAWDRLYLFYEDVNVLLLIYHKGVTDAQIEEFVNGTSFRQGSAADCTDLFQPVDERPQNDNVYECREEFIELPRDTVITFGEETISYTGQITGVNTVTNISELDRGCFNPGWQYEDIADANGDLLPQTVETIREGDGFSGTKEVLDSTEKQECMILVDITYNNLSDAAVSPYIPYCLSLMKENSDGSFTDSDTVDSDQNIHIVNSHETEVVYFSHSGAGKGFLTTGEAIENSLTVTIGFLCNTDILDHAYLCLEDMGSIIEPAYTGENNYAHYIQKVL